MPRKSVFLYYPQLIGYARVLLVLLALPCHGALLDRSRAAAQRSALAHATLALVGASMALDHVDGIVARLCNETSRFGVFLDILIDNVTRTTLYVLAVGATTTAAATDLPLVLAVVGVVCVEWCTFVCTHGGSLVTQQHWKSGRCACARARRRFGRLKKQHTEPARAQ